MLQPFQDIGVKTANEGQQPRTHLVERFHKAFQRVTACQLCALWNNADPPDFWETTRNRRIRDVQGNSNPYVEMYRKL